MKNLKYEDLVQLEQSFLKPTLEKVRKAIQTIFEGKTTRLIGSDFDKNIVFFVDKDLKTAKFEVNEDKVKIHSVDEVSVDSETFGQKFQSLMSEAIDLLSENKEVDSKSKFNEAIEVLRRELSGDKTTIFDKRPPLVENKVGVRRIKLFKENKKQAIKDLSKNLSDLMESYYGKDVIKDTYFEVSLNEGKSNEIRKYEKEPSLLRKVDLAKKSAKTVDMKPIFENVQKWISENEEVFFLTSDKFKERLVESSKTNVSATKDKINEAVKTFMKLRAENEGFKKIADQILKEQTDEVPGGNTETEIGDDRATEPERDELDDKVVSDVDRKSEEDKLGFMRQFVDILEKLLTKIKEVSDEEEVQRRVDFAVDTINKAKEENRWDKDELAEIAKEAIELAAKVEGIEPVDTELSKRAEEEEEAGEMGKETISGEEGIPAGEEVGMEPEIGGEEEIPGEEEEPIFKPRKKGLRGREEEIAEEAVISPDGDITYGDEEGFGGEPQAPEMEKLTCFNCEKDFGVEGGEPSYKCPYCGEAVEGLGGEEAPVDIDKELAPVSEDDGMGNADQSSVNTVNEKAEEDTEEDDEEELDEAKMSTNPAVGKIDSVGGTELSDSGAKMSNKPNIQKKLMKNVEGSTEGIIDKSGEKMSTNPEKGTQKVVDGTKLPNSGKKMSKTPNKGTMKYADGTKLPDSGKKMSKNPDTQKKLMKNVEGSTGEISDSGEKMTTFPAIGAIKTLKEQTQSFPSTQKKLMKPVAGTKITEKKEEEEEGQEQLDEKYMGFKKLVKSLKSKGIKGEKKEEDGEMDDEEMNEAYQVFLKEGAEALAAWIGRKKYGKEKFQQMSKAGKGEVEESGPALADDEEQAAEQEDGIEAAGHEDMETPGEETAEHMPGGEEAGIEDVEPVGAVAPEADIAPVDTEVPMDTEVPAPEADIAPVDTGMPAPEVDIAVGGAEVDIAVDGGSQSSSGKLPDTGEQMSTNPPVGEIETVGETGEAVPPVVRYGDEDANTKPGEGQDFEEEGGEEAEEEYTEEELVEAWQDMNSDKKFLRECKAHRKMNEVAPPGWEGTVKSMKKHKDITNPWALAWHMKGKGMKSHKNECMKKPFKKAMRKSMKSVEEIEEARAKLQTIQEKVENEQNVPKCSSCKKETPDLYEDPKTWGAISSKGQEYLCLECMKRDFPYMVKETYEEVEETENNAAEANVEEASYLPKDADVLGTYGSRSNPERKYYIVKGKDGVTYCTCPSWKFSKDQPKCCKHLQDFSGGGSGKVTDEGTNEEFIREMNSPAIDPFEEELDEKKMVGKKAKPFTQKPVKKVKEEEA